MISKADKLQSGGSKKNIKIWQQNVNKSKMCQLDLIGSSKMIEEEIDIIALQEPYISPHHYTAAARHWVTVYLTPHTTDPGKTRSVILLQSNISSDNWEQTDFHSGDVMAIQIRGKWGKLVIFNIYNDCMHNDTIKMLTYFHSEHREYILGKNGNHEKNHLIWLGDFNHHHPYWDTLDNHDLFTRDRTEQAKILIQAIADLGLDTVLPCGTPTHEHHITKRWSRLDQVFTTEHTLDTIITCEALPDEQGPNSDHFPIVTSLELKLNLLSSLTIRNF